MLFLKRSITALLVFSSIFLASILTAEKTHAQTPEADTTCQLTQYVIVETNPCVKKQTTKEKLFPKESLIPTPTLEERKKEEEKKPQQKTYVNAQEFTQQQTGTLSADLLFEMINQHRQALNLPTYQKSPEVCGVAESRKDEIVEEIFVTGNLHAGFYNDNLPYWATENMIWQHTEGAAMNWWLNSSVHRAAIEGNYDYACGVCNGEVCNMIFTSFTPKASTSASFAQSLTPTQAPSDQIAVSAAEDKTKLTTSAN